MQAEAVAAHLGVWYTPEQILTQRVFSVVADLALASVVGTGGGMLGAAMRLRLFVVQWVLTRWTCTCGHNGCAHRLAANQYVFEQTMKKKSS